MTPFHVEDRLELFEGDSVIKPVSKKMHSFSLASLREPPPTTHSLYSGVALYLPNSISHSARVIGGMVPATGFHSVILNPDSVRRVTPPTTTTLKTSTLHPKSHLYTRGEVKVSFGAASSALSAAASVASVKGTDVEKKDG